MKLVDLDEEDAVVVLSVNGEKLSFTRSQLVEKLQNSGYRQAPRTHIAPSQGQRPKRNAVASISAVVREMLKHGPLSPSDQDRLMHMLNEVCDDEVPAAVTGRLGVTLEEIASAPETSRELRLKCEEFLARFPQLLNVRHPHPLPRNYAVEGDFTRLLSSAVKRVTILTRNQSIEDGLGQFFRDAGAAVSVLRGGDEIPSWQVVHGSSDLIVIDFDPKEKEWVLAAFRTLRSIPTLKRARYVGLIDAEDSGFPDRLLRIAIGTFFVKPLNVAQRKEGANTKRVG